VGGGWEGGLKREGGKGAGKEEGGWVGEGEGEVARRGRMER